MSFLADFYKSIDNKENLKDDKKVIDYGHNVVSDHKDTENLIKMVLSWIVGGILSLMPTFTFIYHDSDITNMEIVFKNFFANKDLFLVVTTLTATAMFEFIFNDSHSRIRYVTISLGIILMVLSIHIFTLLQYGKTMPLLAYIGVFLLGACIINSIVGYYIVCARRGEKRK